MTTAPPPSLTPWQPPSTPTGLADVRIPDQDPLDTEEPAPRPPVAALALFAHDALLAFANALTSPTPNLAALPLLRRHAEATLCALRDAIPLSYEQGLASGQSLCLRPLPPLLTHDPAHWRSFYGPSMLRGWADAWRTFAER